MELVTLSVGLLQVNCHLVWSEPGKQAMIVDPGDEVARIVREIDAHGLTPAAILLTHGHVDHIGAVPELAERYGIPVYVHPDERALYLSPANEIPNFMPAVRGLPVPVDTPPKIPGLSYRVIPTPGHTPGGVCYYFASEGVLLSGDTLFQNSIGRTDLPGGNSGQLLDSIRTQLLGLPPETRVYPGHGPVTTIAREAADNPFLQSR